MYEYMNSDCGETSATNSLLTNSRTLRVGCEAAGVSQREAHAVPGPLREVLQGARGRRGLRGGQQGAPALPYSSSHALRLTQYG